MATVIFKPTESCNANCIYCDVVKKKPHGPKTMGFETLELFFRRINEFLIERPAEWMEIIWHGGEPLLLGPAYFERAREYQEKHCPETFMRIRHSIQSNLTLFSRQFFGPLRRLGITRIGSSYDPVSHIRGVGKERDSAEYNRRFMDAIRLLEEEGFDWGIIYVVTKQSLANPLDIFQFLTNLAPQGGVMFNPVLVYGEGLDHIKVSPEEYVEFIGSIFPVWLRNRKELGHIEPFASSWRNLVDDRKSLVCVDSGACALTHVDVLPDGSASHCGRSADWGLLDYGSIHERSFSQIFADPQRKVLLDRNEVLSETECKGCRFWLVCHGGCPLDGWSGTGSFLHKSEWCYAKKGFLEKYMEPSISGFSSPRAESPLEPPSGPLSLGEENQRSVRAAVDNRRDDSGALTWINPIGGLGDALLVSSVLKQAAERFPSRKFHLVDRTKYREILQGHPAIASIGHPPPGARLIGTDYWREADFRQLGARAYQVLACIFGLERPIEEKLYVPWEFPCDATLFDRIPRKRFNVLICPSSESPRKEMAGSMWESLVERLKDGETEVVQVGRLRDRYIRGAYSLLGLTTPRKLVGLLGRFDAVVTSDNFIMHAASLRGVPAVVLWGPTDHSVYGYPDQIHLRADMICDRHPGGCIGPGQATSYDTQCPKGADHCMNAIEPDAIYDAVMRLLSSGRFAASAGLEP